MDMLTMGLLGLSVLAFGLASWAMNVKLAAQGRSRLRGGLLALAFASFQLLIMGLLTVAHTWWATVSYGVLLIATGTMFLDALAIRYPDSRTGGWWAALGVAAEAKRAAKQRPEP